MGLIRLGKPLLPFATSAVALAWLGSTLDLSPLRGALQRIRWDLLPAVAAVLVALVGVFAWRWRLLLGGHQGWRACAVATAVGLGANQVLPARGGDLLRTLYSARWASVSLHRSLSALVVEKLLDLAAAGAIGALALALVAAGTADVATRRLAGLTSLAVVGGSLAAMLMLRSGGAHRVLRAVVRALRLGRGLYWHAYRPLFHLRRALLARALAAPLALTLAMWLSLYAYAFELIPRVVGIELSWREAVAVLFAASLGLAIPAAPSGVGTFHAAVISGFLIIGRSPAEGLVAATIVHAAFFAGFGLCGLAALPFAPHRARTAGPMGTIE